MDSDKKGERYDRNNLSRRDFLKMAGTGTAALGLGAFAGNNVANAIKREILDNSPSTPTGSSYHQNCDYDTITLDPGETRVQDISDGETFENKLIDQTADGANFYIRASHNPSNWTVRNIGFKGVGYVTEGLTWAGKFQMVVSGDGLMENIFIDNRAPEGERGDTYVGGGYCPPHHSGHIDVRNTFIAGCGNNAFYASVPGDGGQGGTISFKDCYHRDNTVSQYRIGTSGSRVENCVAVVNDPGGRRGTYPGYDHSGDSGKNARLVWGRHCDNMITENCAFYQDPNDVRPDAAFMSKTESASICDQNILTVRNFQINESVHDTRNGIKSTRSGGEVVLENYGYNPTTDVLIDGVPTSPEMAACGKNHIPDVPEIGGSSTSVTDGSTGSDTGGGTTSPIETLTLSGGGQSNPVDYMVKTTDSITRSSDEPKGSIFGNAAIGRLEGGSITYDINGSLTRFNADSSINIQVNGQSVTKEELLQNYLSCQ